MVKTNQKELIKRFIIFLIVYLGLTFSYPFLKPIIQTSTLKINQKIANSFNSGNGFNNKFIVFENQDDDLIAYIKNVIKQKGVAGDTSFIKLEYRTHIYMPYVIMISLLFLIRYNKKKYIIPLSIISIFLFIQLKIWVYIFDQSNHFLVITDSGEYIKQLEKGLFVDINNIINKIINIKGALFIRYIYPVIVLTLLYFVFEKKLK
jgi:hypothetical protein